MAPPSTPRKDSQFAGAAALFRAKDNGSVPKPPNAAGATTAVGRTNSGRNGGFFSPQAGVRGSVAAATAGGKNNNSNSLAPPPFVSPGTKGRSSAATTTPPSSSASTSTPSWKKNLSGKNNPITSSVNSLPFSPSPGQSKPSWKDKYGEGTSFQASSPGVYGKPKPSVPTPPAYYGGSYMNKNSASSGPGPAGGASSSSANNNSNGSSGGMPEAEPDIQITVNVDIQEKIRARRAHLNSMPSCKDDNVPEHVRRAREREERRLRAAEEKEYKSACLVTAAFLGWYARKRYPVLLAENAERLRRRRKEEAERKRRLHAILTIQSTWRMYVPRKRFVFIRDCKRRRDKNEKEIKRITKTIEKMPKETKKEIKELKKEYADKRKDLKKQIKKQMKEEEKKVDELKKQGQTMVDYMKAEQEKLKKQKQQIRADQKVLEQQTELLKQKSDEIATNFASLQAWCNRKQAIIKQHEESDQKCRFRYLPKYRQDLVDRNQHCIAEYRVKEMYRKTMKKIVKEIVAKSSDPKLVEEVKWCQKVLKKELKAIPEVPVPDGLAERL